MAKRRAVGFLMTECGFSERRACRIVGLARSVQQYRPTPKNDGAVVDRLKELASIHAKMETQNLSFDDIYDVAAFTRSPTVVHGSPNRSMACCWRISES